MRIAPFCRRLSLALLALAGMTVIAVQPASAFEQCPKPQFGVSGIAIDKAAPTAAEAQTAGVEEAARIGFQRILYRLLRSDGLVESFIATHDVSSFVDFYHISEENSLEGRYIAILDYCFDAPRMRAAFRESGYEWAELKSPKILVLPVWLAPDGARAWQKDNEWLAGWRSIVEQADGLVDFALLKPTILNERSLRAEDIVAADPLTLRKAATVAGADQIMLVVARLDYDGAQQTLAVEGELFKENADRLAVLAEWVDKPVFGNLSEQLELAQRQILTEFETTWHRANIIRGGETREITVEVPVKGLRDWASRLEAFGSVAVIDSFVVRKVDTSGGLVTLTVVGDDAAVANALGTHDLRLSRLDDGRNVIEPQ